MSIIWSLRPEIPTCLVGGMLGLIGPPLAELCATGGRPEAGEKRTLPVGRRTQIEVTAIGGMEWWKCVEPAQ